MRGVAVLAACVAAANQAAGHTQCLDLSPTDPDRANTFCPAPQAGTCCTDTDEADIVARFDAAGAISDTCADFYTQLICGQCLSYSQHLFERLRTELDLLDSLSLKVDFCEGLVNACTGQGNIEFPTYDGGATSYCAKHTDNFNEDLFYSYPYTETQVFEPGLVEAFPDNSEFPARVITVRQTPDGSAFWLVGQAGHIKSVNADDRSSATTVVRISGEQLGGGGEFLVAYEEGLLDLAFGPMFSESGFPNFFYLSYTVQLDGENPRNRLSRFEWDPSSITSTRNSEEVLLTTIQKPTSIHSGGFCGFKPSAYGQSGNQDLFWATGDGGPQTDPENYGQDTSNMLGSVMRISVPSTGSGYDIPNGNLGGSVLPEICANGFRNPFRCGFDRQTDELYCGDVGHTKVEEIDIVECGNNYGWSRFEGSRCQEAQEGRDGSCDGADRSDFTFPFYEYCHPGYDSSQASEDEFTGGFDLCGQRELTGNAVIGGYVYRGQIFDDLLAGAYIFGDNTNNNVYYVREVEGELTLGSIISDGSIKIIGFAEDVDGELLLIDLDRNIYELPCGDLCASSGTCLDQAEDQPAITPQGCFTDVIADRALPTKAPNCGSGQSIMSSAICASYCSTLPDTEYAGVQFGSECFCGGPEASFDRHGTSNNCVMACSGTPDELCGGNRAIEVFKLGVATPTPEPVDPMLPEPVTPTPMETSPLGCFADDRDDRIMTRAGGSSGEPMSAEICSGLCGDSPFIGTQFRYECWCGSDSDYDRFGPADCTFPCTGNSDEICGGSLRMSVYENGVEPVAPTPTAPTPTAPTPTAPTPTAPTPTPPTPTPTPAGSYLGCFGDTRGERIMTRAGGSRGETMSAEICAMMCDGSPFYGTQFRYECWCGSDSDYNRFGPANCTFPCTGNGDETCGGSFEMSVYSSG